MQRLAIPRPVMTAISIVPLALLCACAVAHAAPVAAGVFGLYGFPLRRDDLSPGPYGGVQLRSALSGALSAEVSFSSFREGDREIRVRGRTENLRGGSQRFVLAHAIVGLPGSGETGLYLGAGAGRYSLVPRGSGRERGPAWSLVIGVERRSRSPLAVDASVRWMLLPLDDGGGRETVLLQAGVNYYLLP